MYPIICFQKIIKQPLKKCFHPPITKEVFSKTEKVGLSIELCVIGIRYRIEFRSQKVGILGLF